MGKEGANHTECVPLSTERYLLVPEDPRSIAIMHSFYLLSQGSASLQEWFIEYFRRLYPYYDFHRWNELCTSIVSRARRRFHESATDIYGGRLAGRMHVSLDDNKLEREEYVAQEYLIPSAPFPPDDRRACILLASQMILRDHYYLCYRYTSGGRPRAGEQHTDRWKSHVRSYLGEAEHTTSPEMDAVLSRIRQHLPTELASPGARRRTPDSRTYGRLYEESPYIGEDYAQALPAVAYVWQLKHPNDGGFYDPFDRIAQQQLAAQRDSAHI